MSKVKIILVSYSGKNFASKFFSSNELGYRRIKLNQQYKIDLLYYQICSKKTFQMGDKRKAQNRSVFHRLGIFKKGTM